MNSSVLEELSPSDEELCARSGPEEDSGTCSSEEELENCWESEETVPRASDELSGSIPGFTPVTPVEESESLPAACPEKSHNGQAAQSDNSTNIHESFFFP
jgi:hypothetical protein